MQKGRNSELSSAIDLASTNRRGKAPLRDAILRKGIQAKSDGLALVQSKCGYFRQAKCKLMGA